jgi:muconolactone D-isomerase
MTTLVGGPGALIEIGQRQVVTDQLVLIRPGESTTLLPTKAREAERALELAGQGHLLRLWTPPAAPGEWRTLGLWRAQDADAVQAILESLPLYIWMTVETTPLTQHPNDPAITKS